MFGGVGELYTEHIRNTYKTLCRSRFCSTNGEIKHHPNDINVSLFHLHFPYFCAEVSLEMHLDDECRLIGLLVCQDNKGKGVVFHLNNPGLNYRWHWHGESFWDW